MTLSIVIVNYNVRHYLEQCLTSVYVAAEGIDTEVFVVDNNSSDDSLAMLRERFPQVRLMANAENVGFARANNQALRQCTGDYVLLLNPDTVVQRDTFAHCIDFIEKTPGCGGVSVKMINGDGIYLKESKRGFPSPRTSFYKISGLIRLLPHSRRVAAYYMGHLSDSETNAVDILPGAFIMLRREVLQQVGLLDESYFMYGEDIDFSWRIHLAGFSNYYLPTTRILHYKGESTRKGSMNYVYTFYNAMSIFVGRYFSGGNARLYNLMIRAAIWLRALLALLRRGAARAAVPVADLLIFFASFFVVKELWSTYWAANINYYPALYTYAILPLYALLLVASVWLNGGYDRPVHTPLVARGVVVGTLLLLVFYSLLDETMRYSRAILVFGALLSLVGSALLRLLLGLIGVEGYQTHKSSGRHFLVVGSGEEVERVRGLFDRMGVRAKSFQSLPPDGLSTLTAHDKVLRQVDEMVFCTASVSVAAMLDCMEALRGQGITFRTAPAYGDVLVGGNYVGTPDALYRRDEETIASPRHRRSKRVFDLLSSALLLLLSPLLFWFQRRKRSYFPDCWSVLTARHTWVGYTPTDNQQEADVASTPLPHLRPAVFTTRDRLPQVKHPDVTRLNHDYAYHYSPFTDLSLLLRQWRNL